MSTGCLSSPYTFPGRVGGLLTRCDLLGSGLDGVLRTGVGDRDGNLNPCGHCGERVGRGGGAPLDCDV